MIDYKLISIYTRLIKYIKGKVIQYTLILYMDVHIYGYIYIYPFLSFIKNRVYKS